MQTLLIIAGVVLLSVFVALAVWVVRKRKLKTANYHSSSQTFETCGQIKAGVANRDTFCMEIVHSDSLKHLLMKIAETAKELAEVHTLVVTGSRTNDGNDITIKNGKKYFSTWKILWDSCADAVERYNTLMDVADAQRGRFLGKGLRKMGWLDFHGNL